MNAIEQAIDDAKQILGWRELRTGSEVPIERIEDLARSAITTLQSMQGKAIGVVYVYEAGNDKHGRAFSWLVNPKDIPEGTLLYTHTQSPAVPEGWQFERVDAETIKIMWEGSGVVVNKDGTMAKAVSAIALYELAAAMLSAQENSK